MKLFHWLDEGDRVQPGISIYRPGNDHSYGGTIRIGQAVFRARWSKARKKLFTTFNFCLTDAEYLKWLGAT